MLTPDYMDAVSSLCQQHGLGLHLDGARIFNAAVALGVDVRAITKQVDSISVCLSKGLGSPVGSLIIGTDAFIYKVVFTPFTPCCLGKDCYLAGVAWPPVAQCDRCDVDDRDHCSSPDCPIGSPASTFVSLHQLYFCFSVYAVSSPLLVTLHLTILCMYGRLVGCARC